MDQHSREPSLLHQLNLISLMSPGAVADCPGARMADWPEGLSGLGEQPTPTGSADWLCWISRRERVQSSDSIRFPKPGVSLTFLGASRI